MQQTKINVKFIREQKAEIKNRIDELDRQLETYDDYDGNMSYESILTIERK